jgi:hypothetical protein
MKDKTAKSFVMMMIIIALSALLVRTAIEALININLAQNESDAQGTLKLIAASLENYANDNHNKYPAKFSVLTQSRPPYLDKDYVSQSPVKGYNYGCLRLESSGYSCYARPASCGLTGKLTYTITTGSLLVQEACKKSE